MWKTFISLGWCMCGNSDDTIRDRDQSTGELPSIPWMPNSSFSTEGGLSSSSKYSLWTEIHQSSKPRCPDNIPWHVHGRDTGLFPRIILHILRGPRSCIFLAQRRLWLHMIPLPQNIRGWILAPVGLKLSSWHTKLGWEPQRPSPAPP